MSFPIIQTVEGIVTQALKRSGRVNPTAAQIQEATDHALQEVKADIMLKADTHGLLVKTATTVTAKGLSRYTIPVDCNIPSSITLLDGPEEWRGIAQGVLDSVANRDIVLDASLSVGTDDIVGKYILLTAGPGIEQYRQIVDYDPGQRLATVDVVWASAPTSGTSYLIVTTKDQLWSQDTKTDFDVLYYPDLLGTPLRAAVYNQEFLLHPVPDKSTYGLLVRYYIDLSLVDEASDFFLQLLREWRSVWIQGIAVKSMQRFDEDRYQSELGVYNFMLDALATQAQAIRQARFLDV